MSRRATLIGMIRYRRGRGRLRTGSRYVRQRAQLRRVVPKARLGREAWPGASAEVDGRQDQARLGQAKMGQTDIRRLLIVGASRQRRASRATSVIRWVVRKGGSANRWLAARVMRKPKMVAAPPMSLGPLAFHCRPLANKMARMIWALTTKGQNYRMA